MGGGGDSSAHDDAPVPQPGVTYPIVLGSSLLGKRSRHEFCMLRYDFKPASASRASPGKVLMQPSNNRVTVQLPVADRGGSEFVEFSGPYEKARDELECVAVFDGTCFRLEALSGAVKSKYTRRPVREGDTAWLDGAYNEPPGGDSFSEELAAYGAVPSQPSTSPAAAHALAAVAASIPAAPAAAAALDAHLAGLPADDAALTEHDTAASSAAAMHEALPPAPVEASRLMLTSNGDMHEGLPAGASHAPAANGIEPGYDTSSSSSGSSSSSSSSDDTSSSSSSDDDGDVATQAATPAPPPAAAAPPPPLPMPDRHDTLLGEFLGQSQAVLPQAHSESSSSSSSDADSDDHRCSDDESDGVEVEHI